MTPPTPSPLFRVQRWVRIALAEIICLKASRQYTLFYTTDGEVSTRANTLKEYEQATPGFIRISHSCIVNPAFIHDYDAKTGALLLRNGNDFMRERVSRANRHNVYRLLEKRDHLHQSTPAVPTLPAP